ncbi:UNVERIFIED_CONTAM: Retrovirus-related Pol polyprotein from transposon opus [Sesamum indicum]
MNAMKDGEWLGAGRTRDREPGKDAKQNTDRVRDLTIRPKYHRYTPLNTTRTKALLTVEKSDMLKWPCHTRFTPAKKFSGKSQSRSPDRRQDKGKGVVKEVNLGGNAPVKGIIYTIAGGPQGGDSRRSRKRQNRNVQHDQLIASIEPDEEITFGDKDVAGGLRSQNDPMVIKLDIANFTVPKVLIDNGSSADIILSDVLVKMGLENTMLEPVRTPLVGFGGTEIVPLGTFDLPVSMGEDPRRKTLMIKFLVVDTPFAYHVILGKPGLNAFRAIVSTYHLKVKFPTRAGIGEVICDPEEARKCYNLSLKKGESADKRRKLDVIEGGSQISDEKIERIRPAETHKVVEVIQGDPSKTTRIGSHLGEQLETMMISLLRKNAGIFAWSSSDFIGVAPEVIVHRLNVDPTMRPVQQKKRNFSVEKNQVIREEVDRLLNAGYIMEVQYTNWLSNVVVVPKPGGKWRVCIDFTDLNKACPKDPYPLSRIDALVDSTAGYELFSMMDAYQGYHQIFMIEEDQDKTSFVTERGIYCYKVMPFGLKNAGATYQRLVNRMFEDQIGKTMEVYVDDMLVKSSRSHDHIAYLEQTFATLRKFRMKLNPMKCTFGVAGGKFLGYLVSERGIEMNPEKIESILKLKSPTNIKEVQKLTENAISLALVREEGGVQSPIYYVSRMLHGAEKRYAQIEKLALALIVTARKLRPYFQGHRIIVLTNHPLCNVLARPEASGRLVKWAVELGEFDIEYQARTALKGQVHQIPRHENDRADSLSKFGTTLSGIKDRKITVMIKETSAIAEVVDVNTASKKPSWKDEIIRYLKEGILPADSIAARRLKMRAHRFTLVNEQLYKRSVEEPLLKCLDLERAEYVMREIHEGSCGNHSGGRSVAQKVIRQGYFWPTLVKDTKELVKRCEACQRFAAQIHTPATQMEPLKVACPFDQWGIDILGPFPTARSQKKFIIVAVEYFSKWIEVEAVAKVTEGNMIEFIWKNIICRFGVPRILISDNGT